MLTDQEQAHLEGAKNLWRYNRGDLFNVAVLVGFAVVAFGVCWLIAHGLVALGQHSHPAPHFYGHIHWQRPKGFPTFTTTP